MKKYVNKIISVFLTVIFIFSCMPSYAEDISETDNSEVYEMLTALGILDDMDMIYYEDIISRAIFIKYAVRCAGISLMQETALPEGIYTDVDENTEGYDEIILAHKMKLISDAEFFNPDRYITNAEAAKILVSLLGYADDAEYKGGFPVAYLNMANSLDIFDGVVFENDGSIDVNNFVLLLLNTLNANPLKIHKIISDSSELYSIGSQNEKPLMTQTLDIHKTEGIVSSNAYASLSGASRVGKGEILIGDNKYSANDADAVKYLGLNVEAYYKYEQNSNKKTILYLKELNNEIITVLTEDIDLNGTTSKVFSYYKSNDKKETVTGLGSAVFIYNGGLKAINEADLEPANGAVTLIDNNEDRKIDVVKSDNYRTVQVSSVSDLSYSVADSLGGPNLDLDTFGGGTDVIIEKDGKAATFDDIENEDIISYAEAGTPASGDIVKFLYISTRKAEGKIESIYQNTLVIDGIVFNASQSIINSSSVGEEGIFYIDMYNRIVVKKAKRDMVYGYIKEKAVGSGMDGGYLLKIFTENNRWVELRLADKVKMVKSNGVTDYEAAAVSYGNTAPAQLVRYKVNSDAEITEIHFAQNIPAFSTGEDAAIANDIFRESMVVCSGSASYAAYRATPSSFANLVGLRDDTKIFVIPNPTYSTNDIDYHVVNTTALRADQWYYDITAYDVDKSVRAGACVMISEGNRNIIGSVSGESNLMVVKSISRVLTDNGDDTYLINGAYSGDTNAKLRMSPDVKITDNNTGSDITASSLVGGDILELAFDADGYVCRVTRYYNISSQQNTPSCTTSTEYTTSTKMMGTVSRIDHENYKIVFNNGITVNGLYTISSLNRVYIYDTARNTVTLADSDAVEAGDYIVAYVRQFSLREAVIIK